MGARLLPPDKCRKVNCVIDVMREDKGVWGMVVGGCIFVNNKGRVGTWWTFVLYR